MEEGLKTTNRALVAKWVGDYSDDLFSWAYHKTSSKEVAEDIVQDTFIAALKGIDRFKGDSNPKTWLTSILNNKIIDYYRKQARSFKTVADNDEMTNSVFDSNERWANTTPDPMWEEETHLLDNPDFNDVLAGCMEALPEKFRIAVNAKYVLDKKAELVCQELDCTPSNYWQMIHRGKLLLKKCLEKKWQP
jgi:RNA polymerase sigma-70 factor (TIGR02943 family)